MYIERVMSSPTEDLPAHVTARIIALREWAGGVGDLSLVGLCDTALEGDKSALLGVKIIMDLHATLSGIARLTRYFAG